MTIPYGTRSATCGSYYFVVPTPYRCCSIVTIEENHIMAAPKDQGNNFGKGTARSTPPHPDNSGAGALRSGIAELNANLADSKAPKPDRTGQSE